MAQLPPATCRRSRSPGAPMSASRVSSTRSPGGCKLARASTEPGRTRELNFFRMGDRLRLVDLPGYGYAKAGRADIERWTTLTRDYLRGRAKPEARDPAGRRPPWPEAP